MGKTDCAPMAAEQLALARADIRAGRVDVAIRRARTWLAHPRFWSEASDVVDAAIDALDLSPESVMDACLADGYVSPDMFLWRIASLLEADEVHSAARIFLRTDDVLEAGWYHAIPELAAALAWLRLAVGRCIARGDADDSFAPAAARLDRVLRELASPRP